MLNLIIKTDSAITDDKWDDYIVNSDNGTMFQQSKFLSYHPNDKFQDSSLVFRKRDKIIALLPAAIIHKDNKKILSSHPGASWGGYIYHDPITYKQASEICRMTIDFAEGNNCNAIEVTLPPHIYQNTPDDNVHFCLYKNGFTYKKRELTSVLCLGNQTLNVDRSVRKAVSKSDENGITVIVESDDWDSFFQLLKSNLSSKNRKPTHSYDELLRLKEIYPQQIQLWSAYKDDRLVGGLCNWEVKPNVWLIFYSCYRKELSSLRLLNRLFYDCCSYYKEKRVKFVDFGTSSINEEVNEGLINFKELYSAHSVFRDTLYLQL